MAQYENLKDYFQGEHIQLIKSKISKYMNTEMEDYSQINDAAVQSLVCTYDDEDFNDPSTYYENSGDRIQACVIKFAKKYGVSCYVAKERLHQLGYDFVDGTIIEFDGEQKKPFYFTPGTLKENETFVIDHANYERLLRENKEFAELINSGRYVYLGYVVCLFDAKYIDIEKKKDRIKLVLCDYAREHADECLLKIKI